MSESPERRWETQNEMGCKLFGQGDLSQAEEAFIAAIREATLLGTENLRLASSLSNLGQLKYKQKDFPEAESLFRRALAIREQVLGPEHQGVLQSVNNLAALHYARGELEQAEAMFRRALWISERQLGYDHPDVAVTLNNLARLNFRRNDYVAAAPLLQRLLTIKQEALGGDHPEIAAILTSLAKVRCAERDYDAAEQLSRRALSVREKAFAADDPIIAISLEALAEICAARGKHDEELTLLERSLAIRQRAPGGEHPALTTTRERVAQLRAQFPAAARADGGLHELAELAGIDVLPEPPQVRREAPTGPRNAAQPQVRKEPPPPVFTPSVEPVWHPNERFEPAAPSTEPSYDTMAPATMFARTEPSAPHAPWTPPASPVVYRPRTPPRVERRFHDEPVSRPWPRPRRHRRKMVLTLAAIAAVGVTTWLVLGRQTAEETGAVETEATTRAPRLTGDSLVGGYSVVRPNTARTSAPLPAAATVPAAIAPAPAVEEVRPLSPPLPEPPASARSSAAPRRAAADTAPAVPAVPALSLPGVQLDRVTKEIEARRARVDSVANRVTVKPPTFEKQP